MGGKYMVKAFYIVMQLLMNILRKNCNARTFLEVDLLILFLPNFIKISLLDIFDVMSK